MSFQYGTVMCGIVNKKLERGRILSVSHPKNDRKIAVESREGDKDFGGVEGEGGRRLRLLYSARYNTLRRYGTVHMVPYLIIQKPYRTVPYRTLRYVILPYIPLERRGAAL